MDTIYIKLIFDRKKKSSTKKEGSVEIRLSQSRRSLYLPTGVRILPKHWHDGQVVNRFDAQQLQKTLDIMVGQVRQTMNDMLAEGGCTIDSLLARLRSKKDKELSLVDFCQQRADIRSYGKSKDSRERYNRFVRWLISYGQIITFADITDENILALDAQLAATGMKPNSRWCNYHRILNSFILDAMDAGLVKRNPYRWLHIDKGDNRGGHVRLLTRDEFRRLQTCRLPSDSLRRVRDLFVFQTYTCLSYTDLASFDASKIQYVKGMPVYCGRRGKTSIEYTIPLLPQAMKILERYSFNLPVISNVKYNEYLKVVALMGGIDKPISSHWARHTGATMLLNEGGIDMEIVAKILGHSSTRITRQVYAKLLDETVVDAVAKLKL